VKLAYVSVESSGSVPVARVEGEIDLSNVAETLEALLAASASAAGAGMVLDLSGVAYLDSAGVRLLFDLGRRLHALGRRLVVVVPDEAPIRRILQIARVDAAVEIESDVGRGVSLIAPATA
jgi:anti-anti-sigma factor